MRRALRALHVGIVVVIAAGVAVQATLAGQFISGLSDALPAHGAVGGILELAGLLLLVIALAHRVAGERARVALAGSIALVLAIQAQAALGWAPGALPTALHVPLGVAIFAGAIALSGAMVRLAAARRREAAGARPVVHAGPAGDAA